MFPHAEQSPFRAIHQTAFAVRCTIYYGQYFDRIATMLTNHCHTFADRAAGSDYIFHNQKASTFRNRETTAKLHLPLFTLGKDERLVQLAGNLLPNDQPADGRSYHHIVIIRVNLSHQLGSQSSRIVDIHQHQSRL